MCVNFIYDLNGTKGPNTIGKDIGIMTVFNATDSVVVAPLPSSASNVGAGNWHNAAKKCTNTDAETRLPNIDELSSMLINENIINLSASTKFWASSVYNSERAWNVYTLYGTRGTGLKTDTEDNARCIKT